jgi:polyisoprenoid-binding protein YceI
MSITEATEIVPAGTWTADLVHSSIGFSVTHMAVDTFTGSFRTFEARLSGDGEPKLTGSARVESIVVPDETLTVHLLSPEFFDADRYPELRFASAGIHRDGTGVSVEGELTLKGVTRPVELRGSITGPVTDPYGNERVGVDLQTTVDRTEFGLTWNAELPGGGRVLEDDVTLTARLALVKEQ